MERDKASICVHTDREEVADEWFGGPYDNDTKPFQTVRVERGEETIFESRRLYPVLVFDGVKLPNLLFPVRKFLAVREANSVVKAS